MLENYLATHLIDIVALIFLCSLIYNNNILNDKRKGPLWLGTILTIIIILSQVGTMIVLDGDADMRFLNIICNVIGFALTPLIPIVLIAIINVKILRVNKLVMLPSIINIIATVLSPWLGIIFYVNVNNHYTRGNGFLIFMAAYAINLMILIISTVIMGDKHRYQIRLKITILSIFVIAGTSIQIIIPSIYSTWHCVTLTLLLYYQLLTEFDGSFDALTKLHNRAAFDNMANKLDGRKPFSIIIVDVNNFKEINDKDGHDFGDYALKKVAAVIRKSFNNHYTCFRVGGDEFYIISSDTYRVKLERQLKKMIVNIEEERQKESRLPTVSYGYSIFKGGKALDLQEVIKEADEQMYYYKNIQKERQRTDPADYKEEDN